jgi:primosomal protein N' (replication factor Y)
VAGAARLGDRPLTYRVPEALRPFAAVGVRALVPLGARRVLGFVLAVRPCGPVPAADGHATRDVIDLPDGAPLFSEPLLRLAREIARETLSSLRDAVECLVPPEVFRQPAPPRSRMVLRNPARPLPQRLGRRQAAMLAAVTAAPAGVPASDLAPGGGHGVLRRLAAAGLVHIREAPRPPFAGAPAPAVETAAPAASHATLLLGDADARLGWIEETAAAAVRDGGQVLVVAPEITDVPLLVERLRGRAAVGVLHSDLTARDRRAVWARIRDGAVDVVIGTRSALFAPLPRLRLIVVEDEQAEAYKSESAPRYHARDVARRRARLEGARLVLGSAAPSVETYAAAAAGELTTLRMPPRRPAPSVTVVDMRAERQRGHIGYLSRTLVQAMTRHLRGGGSVVLIVQQRGYARILLCRECGAAVRCPACDIAMAYDREDGALRCRVCGRTGRAPDVCPRCGGVDLRGVGAGTKRIEEIVRRLFPALRIGRLDAETARGADHLVQEFAGGRVRLLVGTVALLRARRARPTLVGVIDADGPMYLPDFRAAERTLQRLRAAIDLAHPAPAGLQLRPAGMGPPPEAVLQTRVPDHPVMRAIGTGRDATFYDEELTARRDFGYPPYARLVRIVAETASAASARALAERVAAAARARHLDVLGPAPLRGSGGARVQCVLKGADPAAVHDAARAIVEEVVPPAGARLVVDVDPLAIV